MRIPTMPITDSDLMAITIPMDADHRWSEATLDSFYHGGLHPVEARSPDEAVGIARRRWATEWGGNLPKTEMRIYVYETGRGEVLNQGFRFEKDQVPIKP